MRNLTSENIYGIKGEIIEIAHLLTTPNMEEWIYVRRKPRSKIKLRGKFTRGVNTWFLVQINSKATNIPSFLVLQGLAYVIQVHVAMLEGYEWLP